ncbi:hypothetical protein [Desulfosediminicola sp.]|uniref:hypothetical protein n=1 Tax=Desulfosediminicola sp. TaxID=2886825 RepID=UPI003AF2B6C7
MKMRCPHCGVSGSVDDAYMGRTLSCPKCKSKFEAVPEMVSDQPVAPAKEAEVGGGQDDIAAEAASEMAADEALEQTGEAGDILLDADPEVLEEPGQDEIMPSPAVSHQGAAAKNDLDEPIEDVAQATRGVSATSAGDQGKVELPILGSLKEAWEQTNGVKGQIWLAILINILVLAAIDGMVTGLAWLIPEGNVNIAVTVIGQLGSGVVSTILTAGLIYMGVKRLKEGDIRWQDLFSGFEVAGKVIVTWLLSLILLFIGYLLLVLPGIYLTVGYALALPLVVDKKLSPWQALETSRKAIHKVWWKFFALMLLLGLISFLAAIPLGIGLIWVAPMSVVLFGVVYQTIIPKEIIAD